MSFYLYYSYCLTEIGCRSLVKAMVLASQQSTTSLPQYHCYAVQLSWQSIDCDYMKQWNSIERDSVGISDYVATVRWCHFRGGGGEGITRNTLIFKGENVNGSHCECNPLGCQQNALSTVTILVLSLLFLIEIKKRRNVLVPTFRDIRYFCY